MFRTTLLVALAAYATAECPSACSGHGECGTRDMCTCQRNYAGADCSLKTCQFGRAHSDTPVGDLDGSGDVTYASTITSQMYPKGVYEQYPVAGADNTAHAYAECSNKGICDRKAGECECFDGYDGAACQRASCPNDCSGHGTCESIAEIAADDSANVYALWDKDSTMGCACDAGYSGPDCSNRECKYGVDPLYTDEENSAIFTKTTFAVGNTGGEQDMTGSFKIKFFDAHGQEWVTGAIATTPTTVYASSALACAPVQAALEALPNNVVPAGSVGCSAVDMESAADFSNANGGFTWTVEFTGNPGYLKELEIVTSRGADGASAASTVSGTSATSFVYNAGYGGEFVDHFSSHCDGVLGQMVDAATPALNWLSSFSTGTAAEDKLLRKCLGDSNNNAADNVEVFDWDLGSWTDGTVKMYQNPHAVKLVASGSTDGGRFVLMWYDATDYVDAATACATCFKIANKATASVDYNVFTTDGTAERVFTDDGATADVYDSGEALVAATFTKGENVIYTSVDASCENSLTAVQPCLEKGDLVFVVDGAHGDGASGATGATVAGSIVDSGALYTIKKIGSSLPSATTATLQDRYQITLDKNLPFTAGASTDDTTIGFVNVIKFTPLTAQASTSQYEYVSQCSGRGLCNAEDGLCECFTGYTGDDCSTQSVLAV